MKIKTRIVLGLATATVALLGAACTTSASISGVEIYRFKEGEATDELLLENVSAVNSKGESVKPTLNKEGVDYNKAGAYDISFSYGISEIYTKLYVYGMPTLYYAGEELTTDTLTISYRQANESYDFYRNITVLDSFGESLAVTVSENSAEYDGGVGEYVVNYSATDCVGNFMTRAITYTVTMENAPIISNTEFVLGKDSPAIDVDWKNVREAYVYYDGELLGGDFYTITSNTLEFNEQYLVDLSVGTHAFRVKTVEGVTDFTLTILDEGYPVYEMNSLKAEYALGTAIASEPTPLIASHEAYTYSYTLKTLEGEVCEVRDEFGELYFLDGRGEHASKGSYKLKVTGVSADGMKQTERYYYFDIVEPKLIATASSTLQLETLDESVYGVSKAYHFIKPEVDGWSGRLEAYVTGGIYEFFSFDIYVNDVSTKHNGYIGRQAEEGEGYTTPSFSVAISCDGSVTYDNIRRIYDKTTGETVKEYEMKLGHWYTIEANMARQSKDGTFYFYVQPYDSKQLVSIDAYIANVNFQPYSVNLTNSLWTVYNPASGNVTLTKSVDENGKSVLTYKSNANSEWDGRVQLSNYMLEKYQKNYNHVTETEKYELTFEMRFVSAPTTMQFWLMNENGYLTNADPTLARLQASNIARVYDKGWLLSDVSEQGEWYTVYIDIEKLGWLGIRNGTELGMQMGVIEGEVQFRNVGFCLKSNIKNLTAEMFTKVSSNASLTSKLEGTENTTVTTYSTKATNTWDSRVQFTSGFFKEYQKYVALCSDTEKYALTFQMRFTSTPAEIQFWEIKTSGGLNTNYVPTLKGYISSGKVTVTGGKVISAGTDMVQNEWYTVSFDLSKMNVLGQGTDNCGLQLGSLSAFEFKNVAFVKI